ncbi:hypothetical protein GCM10010507_18380 [Streptomyces cinnamoneus]|uniref:Transposase DDE domain-containing protein n=1 Tax=Streptomyces cinnamoneus TaxID=53446 RepID=A0A918TEZ4_STRCJ|nr:hypothetical protein GCM10010507_18380 [Streptomyces cinnamoneus]
MAQGPGNAGSNTASDHIETTRLALAQLPTHLRRGRQTLIRTDSAGGTHAFLDWLTAAGHAARTASETPATPAWATNPHRHRRAEPGAHPARQPGPHPAPPPESRHPHKQKSLSANRRGLMNGRG